LKDAASLTTEGQRKGKNDESFEREEDLDTGQWFNPAAFAPQAAGTFGNVHRNSLRGPGAFNMDLSLSWVFQMEKVGLMFRVDAFNALNNKNLAAPNLNPSNPSIDGRSTSLLNNTFGRQLQLGMRLAF